MSSRTEYSKLYYQNNKQKLQEYNKKKQHQLYSCEETKLKKQEKNRLRYQALTDAFKKINSLTTEILN
jgi:hypothetical protein